MGEWEREREIESERETERDRVCVYDSHDPSSVTAIDTLMILNMNPLSFLFAPSVYADRALLHAILAHPVYVFPISCRIHYFLMVSVRIVSELYNVTPVGVHCCIDNFGFFLFFNFWNLCRHRRHRRHPQYPQYNYLYTFSCAFDESLPFYISSRPCAAGVSCLLQFSRYLSS